MHFWDRHKTITGYYESLTRSICDKYDLTQMEYDILMFLHGSPEFNTAADIVKIRKTTKSHVSTSLKSLESKGLIEKKQSESNKKHIEIFVTESAKCIICEGIDTQKRFAHDVLKGFSDEEITTFINIFEKICNNAEAAYSARTAHPFQRNGAPFRFKLSKAQQVY